MDMDGCKGQRHTKGIDGTDVPTLGDQRCVQLVIITKNLAKSTLLARSTLVDVFGKSAIIVV
jgi:hypothetical protein|tara:strand:+ start:33 stop:218 length:186 start_codon:yes stop_codon:yes gene_type:complete